MFTITAIHQLKKRGYEVELLCYTDSRIHKQAEEEGIVTHPVKAKGYFHPVISWKVARLISEHNFELIHTQASKDLWVLVLAKKLSLTGIPLIMTKQVGSFIVKKDLLHTFIYRNVNYALAISEVIRKNLLDTCPLKESQILLLHNGIDTQRFNPALFNTVEARAEFAFRDDEIVIGMMARFSPGKGHEEFLKALSILSKKYPNIKGLIVGEASRGEDAYANSIQQLAKDLRLHNVIFAGFRKDTARVFSSMDIFAFPSHSEAFGISLVEAMSMSVPSVCTNSDGVLDIAVDGETGYLFQKQNEIDLAAKLEMLIVSPEKRKLFGENARRRAESYFDLEYLTEKVIAIYNQVTPRRKS